MLNMRQVAKVAGSFAVVFVVGLRGAPLRWSGIVYAHQDRAQEQSSDAPMFSAQSELVLLHVSVKDKKNEDVQGLSRDAFTVFDDGVLQPLRFFLDEDAPVTAGILIDNSGSMQPNRSLVLAAATAFVETSNPRDEVFALAFNNDIRSALPADAPFTSDPAVLRGALERTITPYGQTALHDAVAAGARYVEQGTHERKVLVIVSDGADNASRMAFEQLLPLIQASNIVVYTVALIDPIERDANPRRLKQLAEASGGRAFTPENAKQVGSTLQQIASDIRHSYVLAFAPADTARDGKLRHIRVTVKAPDNRALVVRARAGYLVEAAAQQEGARVP